MSLSNRRNRIRARIRNYILITTIGILMFVAIGLSLFLIKIEDTVFCPGVIVPDHTFEIVGHLDAHITKFNHRMGDDVKKGDIIAELDSRSYQADAVALEASIRELEAEYAVQKAQLEILKIEPLPKDLWFARTNVLETGRKAKITGDRLERSRKLQLVSAISRLEFEKIELEAIQRNAELARAEENLRRVESGLGAKYIEKARRDLELVKAKIQGKKAELKFLQDRIAECRIVAPATGRIVELPSKDTWYVARGKVAAVIAAGTRVRAIARISAAMIRKIKPGQSVRVTSDVYNKYQYGNFSGVVKWIGDVPLRSPAGSQEILYPAEVELDPGEYVLKYGSGVELAIVTGKQPAIYALLNMSDEDFRESRRKRAEQRKSPVEKVKFNAPESAPAEPGKK